MSIQRLIDTLLHKKKKKRALLPIFLGLFGVIYIVWLALFSMQVVGNMSFARNALPVSEQEELNNTGNIIRANSTVLKGGKRQTTYILLAGRGGGDHDAPDLTDTLILVGINHEKESISMLSIPRDIYVNFPNSNVKARVNRIYEHFLPRGKKYAMSMLKEKISKMTGKHIDYYVNIDFEGFKEIVDALGGVQITIEKNFYDPKFPDGQGDYREFILRKGTWNLNGEVALNYARSRHSTSDFDRSLRQQQILSAVKKKVSELGYFTNPKKFLDFYNIYRSYVDTDMKISDMIAMSLHLKSWNNSEVSSYNLNDSCYELSPTCAKGGLLYVPLRDYFGGASILLPEGSDAYNLDNYQALQRYTYYIFDIPEILEGGPAVILMNGTDTPALAAKNSRILTAYGFNTEISRKKGPKHPLTPSLPTKTILYFNSIDRNDKKIAALQDILTIDTVIELEAPYSNNDAQIEIVFYESHTF